MNMFICRGARSGAEASGGIRILLKAAWRGIFIALLSSLVGVLTLALVVATQWGFAAGVYSAWCYFYLGPLVGLPAGLFAFLWDLRPRASEGK